MRLWVRKGVQIKTCMWLSRTVEGTPNTSKDKVLYPLRTPAPRNLFFRVRHGKKEKKALSRTPPLQGHSWLCHHRISTSQLGNGSPIAFRSMKQSMHAQTCPAIQDRLTHVQAVFTWNHSPLQSSKLSFEYLLLPPRSAATVIPPRCTLRLRHKLLHPPTHDLNMFKTAARYQSHA